MRRQITFMLATTALLSLSGCGGQLGHDSPVQVRLDTTSNTLSFSTDHVIVSPNNGSAVSSNAASDTQTQPWAIESSNSNEKEIDFTTASQQVPYFLYVQNSSGAAEQVRLRIIMDGNSKYDQVLTVPANSTVQEQTIFRNNVQNP